MKSRLVCIIFCSGVQAIFGSQQFLINEGLPLFWAFSWIQSQWLLEWCVLLQCDVNQWFRPIMLFDVHLWAISGQLLVRQLRWVEMPSRYRWALVESRHHNRHFLLRWELPESAQFWFIPINGRLDSWVLSVIVERRQTTLWAHLPALEPRVELLSLTIWLLKMII